MAHICTCKFPLLIIDSRDGKGKEIEYLAMPIQTIEGGDMSVPDIEYVETEGFDGITRGYISVTWKKVEKGDIVKKYDVVGHIVTAGCQPEDASKGEDGMLVCDEKNIYVVLHPIEEWIDRHIIDLHPGVAV